MKNFLKYSVVALGLAISLQATAQNSFAYELSGYNHRGFCSTGYKSFAEFGEFCMGLQSRKLNNNCAESERYQVFLREGCFEKGFRFLESLECRVSFFEKSLTTSIKPSNPNWRSIYSARACIGRDKFGKVISNQHLHQSQVKPGLFVDMDLSFINAFDSYGESRAQVRVLAFEGDYDGTDAGIPIMVEEGSFLERFVYGNSLKNADYTVKCQQIAFCAE